MTTTAAEVVRCIRASDALGIGYALTDEQAELYVNLFASIAATEADLKRDRALIAANQNVQSDYDAMQARVSVVMRETIP